MAEAMYRQIADDLRQKIKTDELAPGSQLPTENDLQQRYNASRNTVRDAIKWLITRGLVETRPGQGTFVTERITPFVTTLTGDPGSNETAVYEAAVKAERREPRVSPPQVEIQRATAQVAAALGVDRGASVISRHERCFIDDTPWAMQTSIYPMTLALRGASRLLEASEIEEGAVAYLAGKLGIKQVGYQDQVKVRAPDEQETAFFKLPADGRVSVFSVLRTTFDQEGTPVRLTISVYPADRNQFAVNVGDVPAVRPVAQLGRDTA
jgi:GntR family transcriptional regulator